MALLISVSVGRNAAELGPDGVLAVASVKERSCVIANCNSSKAADIIRPTHAENCSFVTQICSVCVTFHRKLSNDVGPLSAFVYRLVAEFLNAFWRILAVAYWLRIL